MDPNTKLQHIIIYFNLYNNPVRWALTSTCYRLETQGSEIFSLYSNVPNDMFAYDLSQIPYSYFSFQLIALYRC